MPVLHRRDGHTTTFLQVERFNTSETYLFWPRHSRALTDEAMTAVLRKRQRGMKAANFTFPLQLL